ncbi:MAG: hypothetical protein V4501_00320 [Pseudomonadota bacterium]
MQSYQNRDDVNHTDSPQQVIVLSRSERYLNISASLLLGGSAGIPYASPAYRAAGEWHVLGVMFAGGTIVCFGGASTWGWHNLLQEITEKYHTRQIHVNRNSIKHVVSACALATCSGLLNMYIVKKYNNNSLLMPLITFTNWFGWDASGFYKFISYVTAVGNHNELENLSPSDCERLLKKMIMVFPIGNLIVNSYLSFQAGEEVVGHNVFALPFVVLALSQFSLEVFSAYELVQEGFADEGEEAVLTRNEALAKLLFKVLVMTMMLFATSSDVFIAIDNFGENAAGYLLGSLAVGSSLILGQYVLSDLASQGLMLFSSRPAPSRRSSMVIEEEKDIEQNGEAAALLSNEEDEDLSSENESSCRLC